MKEFLIINMKKQKSVIFERETKPQRQEIIQLKDLCKRYKMGDEIIQAVCDVNISIYRGDFVAIVGPSGSGK